AHVRRGGGNDRRPYWYRTIARRAWSLAARSDAHAHVRPRRKQGRRIVIPTGHLNDELLSADADGALQKGEARAVREHLATCASCRRRAEGVRSLAERVRSLPPEDGASTALRAAIEASFATHAKGHRARRRTA